MAKLAHKNDSPHSEYSLFFFGANGATSYTEFTYD